MWRTHIEGRTGWLKVLALNLYKAPPFPFGARPRNRAGSCWGVVEVSLKGAPGAAPECSGCVSLGRSGETLELSWCCGLRLICGVGPGKATGAAGGCLEGRHWQNTLKLFIACKKQTGRQTDKGNAWLRVEYERCCHDYGFTFPAWSKNWTKRVRWCTHSSFKNWIGFDNWPSQVLAVVAFWYSGLKLQCLCFSVSQHWYKRIFWITWGNSITSAELSL